MYLSYDLKFSAVFLLVLLGVCCASTLTFADPTGATITLQQAKYTNIHTTGNRIFPCGLFGYFHKTGFTATAPDGHSVTGTVCEGASSHDRIELDK